jgi:Pilus formation protein N terminal region
VKLSRKYPSRLGKYPSRLGMAGAPNGLLTRLNIMLRRPFLLLALLSGFGFAGVAMAAPAPVLSVTLDQARIARIPDGTITLVIGNPIVADVTMVKGSGAMVVTGKGFGETNLIALDGEGKILDEKTIRVVPGDSSLIVQRGMERESYSCAPQCMPTVQLGDGKQFNDASSQITARNGLVAPSQSTQSQH